MSMPNPEVGNAIEVGVSDGVVEDGKDVASIEDGKDVASIEDRKDVASIEDGKDVASIEDARKLISEPPPPPPSIESIVQSLTRLLPNLNPDPVLPVSLNIRGIRDRGEDARWQSLLGNPKNSEGRDTLLANIHCLLGLNEKARAGQRSIAEIAGQEAKRYRESLEKAVVGLLDQNRAKEEAVRSCDLFFANLGTEGKTHFHNKVFVVDAMPQEVASEKGREWLEGMLKQDVRRPDPRAGRGYILVPGSVGDPDELSALGEVVHKHRAVLISDAPTYTSVESLQDDAVDQGLLEQYAGEAEHYRHMILLGNQGRAREGFVSALTGIREMGDVFVPLSAPWFARYLRNVAMGRPVQPPIGYQNPIPGLDGVRIDLLLDDVGHLLFANHRINPGVLKSSKSHDVLIWAPFALSKKDGGVQMGVSIAEMIVVRYAEWVINRHGLLANLKEGERIIREKLSDFVTINSGPGDRFIFRMGSLVDVTSNESTRMYDVKFHLRFHEVAESARIEIQMKKPAKEEAGNVAISGH